MKRIEITESMRMSYALYEKTAKIHNEIKNSEEDVIEVIFDSYENVGQTFLFFLSNLPFIGEKYKKKIIIRCNKRWISLLERIGYIDLIYQDEIRSNETDIAPILKKCAKIITTPESVFSLVTAITRDAPVEMNDDLSSLFISKVGEMFNKIGRAHV